MRLILLSLLGHSVLLGGLFAATAGGDAAAYERSNSLRERYDGLVIGARLQPYWLDGGKRFCYLKAGHDGDVVLEVESATGEEKPFFDHEALAVKLGGATESSVSASHLRFADFKVEENGDSIRFEGLGYRWRVELPDLELRKLGRIERDKRERDNRRRRSERRRDASSSERGSLSPDGKFVAALRNHNVYVRKVGDGEEIQLSNDGVEGHAYGLPVFWAPDSRRLAVWKTKRGQERLVHYVDSAPEDQVQPLHFTRSYAKPGDEIDTRAPHIFTTDWTSRHMRPDESLFPNPFVTRNLLWSEDSKTVRFEYIERGFGVHRVLELSATSGQTRVVVDESSDTFVDVFHKGFRHDVEGSNEILWTSERDGWNHLYLLDGENGSVKKQVTQGPWVVRGVEHVDEEAREVIFRASGYYADQDPYFVHYFRVGFDGEDLTPLTSANGEHRVAWSPDRQYLIATWSRVDHPSVHELRSGVDGRLIKSLGQADISRLRAAGWRAPEIFVSKDRDGAFDLWGLIFRPSNFDRTQSYPVIEHIYAGPHSAFVPKSFRSFSGMQEMAELGFIVVKLDARGTSHRSREFHHFCHRNLGDSGFPDRIAWMRSAAKKVPQMDLTRVGIYGGSAGGQSALRALLAHGDFYKAAAADCGCHDNRMDKIWWNELWMDWPVGPHYEEQSNVTQAHRLEGKLLLTVGELDTNVDPASTMQVVDALIKADKDFEMLVIPGANHGVGERPYASRRRKDFFVRHLLGVEPRWTGASETTSRQ